MNDQSRVIGIEPHGHGNTLAWLDDMNRRQFRDHSVRPIVVDRSHGGFALLDGEHHVESRAVPVVKHSEQLVRRSPTVVGSPQGQSVGM